jgi:hypothetical protein
MEWQQLAQPPTTPAPAPANQHQPPSLREVASTGSAASESSSTTVKRAAVPMHRPHAPYMIFTNLWSLRTACQALQKHGHKGGWKLPALYQLIGAPGRPQPQEQLGNCLVPLLPPLLTAETTTKHLLTPDRQLCKAGTPALKALCKGHHRSRRGSGTNTTVRPLQHSICLTPQITSWAAAADTEHNIQKPAACKAAGMCHVQVLLCPVVDSTGRRLRQHLC